MLVNTQPIEKQRDPDNGSSLLVHSIFDTIQGEGPFTGVPSIFVRLTGCNLICSGCDTEYTQHRVVYTPESLVQKLKEYPSRDVIVLTGGEPFRQNFVPTADAIFCFDSQVEIQVETNGTLWQDLSPLESFRDERLMVVCSPKTPKLHEKMWDEIDVLKYVVSHGNIDEMDGLPLLSVGEQYGRPARPPEDWEGDIYVQPLDVQDEKLNAMNRQAAVDSCMKFGYTLCLQIQKLCDLP